MVVIRMCRKGRVNRPVYGIVVADSRRARDGRFLEEVGQYDPLKEGNPLQGVKEGRIQHWVSLGAKLSPTVRSLMKKFPQEAPHE